MNIEEEFDIRPSYEITETFVVEIYNDYDTVRDFMKWQMDTKIYSLLGFGFSGRGASRDVFLIEHLEAVKGFFSEREAND